MLAMRLFFWDDWPPKPPVVANRYGSRYRGGSRARYIPMILAFILG